MKDIYEKYLAVLRAFVQGTAPEKLEPQELQQVMELAKINSTGGILCYVYMGHPELVDPAAHAAMRRHCLGEITMFGRRTELAKMLAGELDKNGIDFVVFKGFVVRDYYPVPELRTFSDVDFIIHKEDRRRSDELMLKLGYQRHEDWEPSYSYAKGVEYYELHSRVIGFDVSDRADYVGYFSDIWGHTRQAQVLNLPHAWELKPEFHFLYMLTHIAKHISRSGAGVRMYLDLAFFIRHYGDTLDWDWVKAEMKKLNLLDFAAVALAGVEHWFGVESPMKLKQVTDEVLEDFTDFTISGGVYGYVGRDQGEMFLKQQNRNGEKVSRFRTLLFHAFPPVKVLVNKYAYLGKYPWLLPVAWIQRLLDKRKEWGRFASSTKQVLTADEEKVRKLRRIYQEIGL